MFLFPAVKVKLCMYLSVFVSSVMYVVFHAAWVETPPNIVYGLILIVLVMVLYLIFWGGGVVKSIHDKVTTIWLGSWRRQFVALPVTGPAVSKLRCSLIGKRIIRARRTLKEDVSSFKKKNASASFPFEFTTKLERELLILLFNLQHTTCLSFLTFEQNVLCFTLTATNSKVRMLLDSYAV